MALTTTIKYYLKNGDVTQPFISRTLTNPANIVVSTSNPPGPSDVEITEGQYNTYVQTNEANAAQEKQTRYADKRAARLALVASITPKLAAIGLTQGEIDLILS